MGWSSQFIEQLKRKSIVPKYRLIFQDIGSSNSNVIIIGSDRSSIIYQGVVIKSLTAPRILKTNVKIQGTAVTPQSWNVSFGGWALGIVGDIRYFSKHLTRGRFAKLECDIGTGYEIIAWGQLKTSRRDGPITYLQFADAISSLQSGVDADTILTSASGHAQSQPSTIMRYAGFEDTITINYNVVSDTELYVNSVSIYEKETGQNGVVKLSNGADTYYLEWTGKGVNYLTVIPNVVVYPTVGSTIGNLTTANGVVNPVALLNDFPGDILGKIIMSTGTGSNGSLDKYPAQWSIGANPGPGVFAFDHIDSNWQKRKILTLENQDPSYKWKIPVEAEWTSGLREFCNLSQKCGIWPVFRQGKISIRGCVDPYGPSNYNNVVDPISVVDSDIQRVVSHDLYNPQNAGIYVVSNMYYGQALGAAKSNQNVSDIIPKAKSLPIQNSIDRDNALMYDGGVGATGLSLRKKHADADQYRMLGYDNYTHEKLTLDLDIRFSILCAGDLVSITSDILFGLCEGPGETYQNRIGMVIGTQFDIGRQQATVTISILPTQNYRNS